MYSGHLDAHQLIQIIVNLKFAFSFKSAGGQRSGHSRGGKVGPEGHMLGEDGGQEVLMQRRGVGEWGWTG